MKHYLIILVCAIATFNAFSRTKTSTHKLDNAHAEIEAMEGEIEELPEGVDPKAISIKGYTKKASDSKEAFFVTNKTKHRISQIKLRLRYTTVGGELLHERVAIVNVTLKPGETQLTSIKSWDIQRQFYYYAGAKPRKTATPYKIAYRLIGYSIPIGE